MTLLIFNPMDDFHCNYLIYHLKKRNISFIELGPFHLNEYSFCDNKLIYNDIVIENVHSIYIRSNMIFTPEAIDHTYLDTYNEQMKFKSRVENLRSWLQMMQHHSVRMINPPGDHSKYLQLYKLIQAGLPIPKTCITNSVNQIDKFKQAIGRIVYKPLMGGYYCRELSDDHLHDWKEAKLDEPAIFQEFIEGTDIRVYVLNGEILSAHEIHKQAQGAIVDYRMDPAFSSGESHYELIDLPSEIQSHCIKAAEILGLAFTGIDLKRTSSGEYYLLECNSMPMYLDLEIKNDVNITNRLIDYLTENTDEETVLHFKESFYPSHSSEPISKKDLFDYRRVYEEFYHQKQQKNKTVILPIMRDQIPILKEYKDSVNEDSCVVLSVDDEGNGTIIDILS